MTVAYKRLEIAHHLGRWEVVHNGVSLCDFATFDEAKRAADAVARSQPDGDQAVISIEAAGAAGAALTSSQPWRG